MFHANGGKRGSLMAVGGITLALVAMAGAQIRQQASGGVAPAAPSGGRASVVTAPVAGADMVSTGANGFLMGQSYKNDRSPALRDIKPILAPTDGVFHAENEQNAAIPTNGHVDQPDPVVQSVERPFGALNGGTNIPAPLTGWEGVNSAGSGCNCAPPDTDGDVGPNHYVQAVNGAFAVYSKSGTLLYGPAQINTVWSGFGGACQTRNDGDPIVLYDAMADRWLISQFTSASPYNECVAISATNDPTGAWNRYAFQLSTTDFPDYPHFGVWPDGYYMSVNWFSGGRTYAGPRPYVFDRNAMLAGTPASFQTTGAALGSGVNPIHPADLDGATLPPTGSPAYYLKFGSPLGLFKFHVDWTTPANTSWSAQTSLSNTAAFTQLASNSVPQPSTSTKLDSLGDRLMHRVVYRNMAGTETLLATHSVNVSTSKRSVQGGVRWYEIRNPASATTVYQQGTYAPADGLNRWMPGISMDKTGDIAVGYSVSSSSVYPGIRYTARTATSPAGTMDQGEGTMFTGSGYQSGVSRWGDYTTMSIDPVDDCTFWFTTEYNNSGGWGWGTRIGSFKLGSCQ